jgi:hypothetical protein
MKKTQLLALAAMVLAMSSAAQGGIIADSVADFSDTQGYRNWYYAGYYAAGDPDGTYNSPSDLTYLPFYASNTWMWSDIPPHYYPWINAEYMCPASLEYPGYDVWAVRRWVSTVEGPVHITATMHRHYEAPYGMGYGSRNYILVDYAQVSGNYLSPYDYSTYVVELDLNVSVGTVIDFITTTAGTNSYANNPYFVASIIPEPSACVLLAVGAAGLLRRRRK